MAEQQRGRRAIEVGPTGQTVAANIARLRERRGLTTRQLSGVLERAGRNIPASGITRMEKGERVVTVDELAALAVAFGVSPAALLLPLSLRAEAAVEVTGGGSVSAEEAWQWANGRRPLHLSEETAQTQLLEHQLYGLPQWLRDVQPGVRKARFGGRHGSAELNALVNAEEQRAREGRDDG
ncbi:helix-turn-helix domain-containing protein [Streptomyces sp. WAC08401]|uniref:helix-turn-helix domain-containing protein n=1 Tax=Streptomyces sp. WAC08401 TaxID=2487413 RepID=UPI00163D120F|nr:helix-turn-helix transcriptional regulator [Streptomyces sp. WAC08401]